MIQCFDNESSDSLQSNELYVCHDFDKGEDNAQQNQFVGSQQDCAIVKQFSIHGNLATPNKFPFHLYLKQRYDKLSFKELIRIFRYYFKCHQKLDQQIKLECSHIQILNEGLNLFTKVPANPLLFLNIDSFNQKTQIFTLKNYNGEIVHFQILDKNKKRITTLIQIKRRIKGRPYIVIKDNSFSKNQNINRKGLQKLSKNINFFYIITFHQQSQLQKSKIQLFQGRKSQFVKFGEGAKINIGIDEIKNQVFAFSSNIEENMDYSQLLIKKQQFQDHFQTINKQQTQLIQQYNSAPMAHDQQPKIRLRVFDYMYINFIKETGKNREQFMKSIEKLEIKYARTNLNVVNQQKDHYTQRMPKSRRCKHCQIVGQEGQNMKPKFKCMACSKKFQQDIPLCIRCWGEFHEEVLPVVKNVRAKDMKKVYKQHLKQKSKVEFQQSINQNQQDYIQDKYSQSALSNSQSMTNQRQSSQYHLYLQNKNSQKSSQSHKSLVQMYSKNEEVKQAILKLNDNMTQIDRLMEELEQESSQNTKIVKKFNQVLFIHIIESFNFLMQKYQQKMSETNSSNEMANENDFPTPISSQEKPSRF